MNENDNTPMIIDDNQNQGQNQNTSSHQATTAGKENQANADANNLEFGEEIRKMLNTAGTLDLTTTQHDALYAPLQDSDVYLKPDGLVYLTWTKYAGRLTKAFGGTGWAMIPQGMPKILNNLIVWGFHLVIKGVYCGFAIGEQSYFNNGRMTYGEACEGSKSNALTRLCKALGIGLELWDKDYINKWLDKYAVKQWDQGANEGRGRSTWSLRPNAFGPQNQNISSNLDSKNTPPAPVVVETIVTPPVEVPTQTPEVLAEAKKPVETARETKKEVPAKESATTVLPTIKQPVVKKIEAKMTIPPSNTKVTEKGYTGKAKAGKLQENNDFLNKGKTTEVPIEQIPDSEIDAKSKSLKSKYTVFNESMDKVDGVGSLKMLYEQIKSSLITGEITEDEKEALKQRANGLFVKLSAKK